ncbi:MAG: hypothetical protein A3A04_02360 [Candidatus Harrisonbacteria bacterium RIFCSPLOWO2_01_FULL_40_28]|uniref:Uncharacterized protein n=1 Tax=Candidatus Harrisonbacteria bacterium RIFCSPLOWO2_01_FULL_40_28 TaxID=1798406 RepID=A0A1G1ZNX9_9BACT|nr:MAG: hypothetical protein A3A04_02360 [Candidatus Harrisonbacteria bacterium RIFCSPLOWO2_01_FULL_40_28]
MAIVIDQEKKSSPWFALFIIAVILLLVGLVVYYLFFVDIPKRQEVILPASLQNAKRFAGVDINVSDIVGDTVFKALRQDIKLSLPNNTGRSNPFVPF